MSLYSKEKPNVGLKMTFLNTWEDFEKAAERLYLQDPMKVRIKKKNLNFKSHKQRHDKVHKCQILTKFYLFFRRDMLCNTIIKKVV